MEKDTSIRCLYEAFADCSFRELEDSLLNAETREERVFYRKLINLKLQMKQEAVIGEKLV